MVATPTDKVVRPNARGAAMVENGNGCIDADNVKVLEKRTVFDEFVVWGHEAVPAGDDPFIKGVDEWVKFAEAVCLFTPRAFILLFQLQRRRS